MLLILDGDPMLCPRPRATSRNGHGAVHMPPEYDEWKKAAALILASQWRKLGMEFGRGVAVRVSICAVFGRPQSRPDAVRPDQWKTGGRVRRWARPDADNLLKAVNDAIQDAKIVEDDLLVEIGFASRWYGAIGETPRTEIIVEDIELCHFSKIRSSSGILKQRGSLGIPGRP